jgi:hypothetical protein
MCAARANATWRNAADVVRREIAARDHGNDAGHLYRARNVYFANNRMRNRGACERGMHLASHVQIVSEFSATGDEGCVLAAKRVPFAAKTKTCAVVRLRSVLLRTHGCLDSAQAVSAARRPPAIPPCNHSAWDQFIWQPLEARASIRLILQRNRR